MDVSVSIITPFHNDADFLPSTLHSILAQTFKNWELLLIDDCSTDLSSNIAEQFARTDSRIRYLRLAHNGGPAIARNLGIKHSQGRYIAFLDADDLWHVEKLEMQIKFMKSHNAVLSCTSYSTMNEDGTLTGKDFRVPPRISYQQMLTQNYIGCLTAMYDVSLTGKLYMPEIRKRQDYGLWLKIIERNGPAHGLDQVLGFYRRRHSSVSSNKLEMIRYNWQLMHNIQNLGTMASLWYVLRQIANRILK